ncbi:MAG TPA: hypothetical protein GXX49_06680 [Clostridiaceae bacterium]|nr:hypothetical protein [Clostridiaceae bacterium]
MDNNVFGGFSGKVAAIPGSIRELLKKLIERRVTIVLDANVEPECVEIENVVGNILVAEFGNKFKFVDIDCICEIIVDRDELLEALLGRKCCNDNDVGSNASFDCNDLSDVLGGKKPKRG